MTQRNRLSTLAFGALLTGCTGITFAVAPQRTFVSSHGNDANPCSLASPCRGFAAAVATVAAKGEVLVLDSAGYGPLTITKSVSLIAPNGIYAGITVVTGDGITVDAPGATVVLRGLSITGQGGDNGINLLHASFQARLRIESCVVSGMGIDGIMFSANEARLIMLDTIVRDNGASGIGGDANAVVVLDHVRSENNGTNGFYMNSFQLGGATATITDSVFADNVANGIWVASTGTGGAQVQVERSVMAHNGGDGIKISATGHHTLAQISRNVIHQNAIGVEAVGSKAVNATITENVIGRNNIGIAADGLQTVIAASANSVSGNGTDFSQINASTFYSHKNNVGLFVSTDGLLTPGVGY